MMRSIFSVRPLCLAIAGLWSLPVLAAPTAGAYVSDQTNTYVYDATSEAIGFPNMVLCFINGTGGTLTDVVNAGNYVALVDDSACNRSGNSGGAGSAGSTGAQNQASYVKSIVNSTRTSNSAALIGNVWFEQTEDNVIIYGRLNASSAPTTSAPYGTFHMDFCGKSATVAANAGSCGFKGYVEGAGASVLAFQEENDGGRARNIQVSLSGSETAGSGRVIFSETENSNSRSGDWKFAFNTTHFRRSNNDGTSEKCFDRSLANANKTVWRYGLYDTNGARVTRNSGFPIRFTSSGNTQYGWVGYYGMWTPSGVTLSDGDTVTRDSFSGGTASSDSYTLIKKDGRLKKLTLNSTTLAGITNVPFFWFVNQTFTDSNGGQRSSGSNLEIKWSGSAFVITGASQPGQQTTPVTGAPTIPSSVLQAGYNMFGWSQALGGEVMIQTRNSSNTFVAPSSTSGVKYRVESVLTPGSGDWASNLTLSCVSDCPKAGTDLVTALNTSSGNVSAFQNVTKTDFNGNPQGAGDSRMNFNPVANNGQVTYIANATTGLLTSGGSDVTWTSTSAPSNSQYTHGFQSGKLVDATGLASLDCDGAGPGTMYCPHKLGEATTVYVWETGHNSWNKYSGLRQGSTAVTFDPPLGVNYTVPASGVSTNYANATLALQYNGFGDLWGIPGRCIDPSTGNEAQCGQGTHYVADFAIPEGASVTSGSSTYYVKPLEQEARLSLVSNTSCSSLTLPSIATSAMPGLTNYTDPSVVIGTKPTVTSAPRVIHGVVQY